LFTHVKTPLTNGKRCAIFKVPNVRRKGMSQELVTVESSDIQLRRAPDVVLAEAQKAAKALTDVVSKKKKPVMFGGEQYLEFEDWQTLGRFYGISVQVIHTMYIEHAGFRGYEAYASACRLDGQQISRAEAMCMNDEPNWKGKPMFMLRSMAQTRACAKALRNVLSWVVVLAGYKPTPAEEIAEVMAATPTPAPPAPPKKASKAKQELRQLIKENYEGAAAQKAAFHSLTGHEKMDEISDAGAEQAIAKLKNILEGMADLPVDEPPFDVEEANA
jgi:hypothetical protein